MVLNDNYLLRWFTVIICHKMIALCVSPRWIESVLCWWKQDFTLYFYKWVIKTYEGIIFGISSLTLLPSRGHYYHYTAALFHRSCSLNEKSSRCCRCCRCLSVRFCKGRPQFRLCSGLSFFTKMYACQLWVELVMLSLSLWEVKVTWLTCCLWVPLACTLKDMSVS